MAGHPTQTSPPNCRFINPTTYSLTPLGYVLGILKLTRPDWPLTFPLKSASLIDLPISVNGDSILLVTYAINLNVILDFFLSSVTHLQSVNIFCWLSFKCIQNLTTFLNSTFITLTKPPLYLVWMSTDKFKTDVSALLSNPHPHRVFIAQTVTSAILWKCARSRPLLKLHNYSPPTQTESQSSYIGLSGPTSPDPSLSSSLAICMSIYSLPNMPALWLLFKHGKHASISGLLPLLFPLPGIVCLQVYASFTL